MATNAELQAQLTETTKRATDAEARVSQLTKDLETVGDRAEQSAKMAAEYGKRIDTLNEELRATNASLTAYKGSATKARDAVTILKRALSPDVRPIGAPRPPKTDEQLAERAAALAAAFAADTTELVFSDGRREIRELAPLIITGDAWRDVVAQRPGDVGRVLNAEIDLEPGDCQRQEMELKGFALLNEAGEQVGWCALPDAIVIGRNQHFRLPLNMVRF